MKIIAWNCNMAFRKKAAILLELKPDIVVVPECECPAKLKFTEGTPVPKNILWHGENQNKGLGVFSYGDYKLKLLKSHNSAIKTILPISVTGGEFDFILLAIWAYNPQDKGYHYVGQVWKAINYYEKLLKKKNVILAGDFNSNTIWDKLNRKSNHSMVVEKLGNHRIFSAYHSHLKQIPGEEAHPTFYLYKNKTKPYHLDYCFASSHLIEQLESVEVGKYRAWSKYSDHKPVIVTFKV
ncbi:MAG: endonuclease/exonuclease/phosphatase family protein [Bacteroidota bacterium]